MGKNEASVRRFGPWEVPESWSVQRPLQRPPTTQLGTYTAVIELDDKNTPCIAELHIRANPPLHPDDAVTVNLGEMAKYELRVKLESLIQTGAAHERGGVWFGTVGGLDDLTPTPEAVVLAAEATTLARGGRRRGARQDPKFLAGIAQLVEARDPSTTKSERVREVAERQQVNEGTVWRWLRQAGTQS